MILLLFLQVAAVAQGTTGGLWQEFGHTFGSGPMSGGLYALLTLAIRLPMRLVSRFLARLPTNLTGTNSSPLIVTFIGDAAVFVLHWYVPWVDDTMLYGSITTAGLFGLMEKHVVAPVTTKADEAMDKSAVFNPKPGS